MFVGSVDWLLNLACSLDGCRVSIFDCIREYVVWDSKYCDELDIAREVSYQGFGEYEVCSYDLWVDADNRIHMEINIEMDEEDE